MGNDALRLARVTAPTHDVRALVSELEEVLSAEYAMEQRHGLSIDAIFEPHVRFFVASQGAAAVGCGGVAFFDGFAEVKRMYVRPAARGTGVACAILERLESDARAAGLSTLCLETGTKQEAALRMYRRAGFTDCAAFGAYAKMPPEKIVASIFLSKPLTAP